MDQITAHFYDENAQDVFERYEAVDSKISEYFLSSFPTSASILDVGAGSARDLNKLLNLGYDAYGVEPCEQLRTLAILKTPNLVNRLNLGALPAINDSQQYDGVLCSAVLMHIPASEHLDALVNIRSLLKLKGRLLLSIPGERPDIDDEQRDGQGRLFEHIEPDKLKLLCARLGMECIAEYHNDDSLGRLGYNWVTLLFQKKAALGRPLDRIESVLRNDRKTATYKLALLRAFCDLAERDDNAVNWRGSKQVAIPIRNIAECWLLYYWPLVASPTLIPQNNSIASGGKPMKFRASLQALIDMATQYYGGTSESILSLFCENWKKNTLPEPLAKQLNKTLTTIQSTIKDGPVKYAEQGDMFSYDNITKAVLIDAELWTEFCLTGYWVKDSLLLRWAELCVRFASNHLPQVSKGIVIEILLQAPEIKREQKAARELYLKQENLRCVWSDRSLKANTLHVDHALPYSLWHNNQLWNLLPSHQIINNKKSDSVPSSSFLKIRQEAIINCWQYLHTSEKHLFEYEVERTLGAFDQSKWEGKLFSYMKNKAEQGIYSRGAKSWSISEP